jgi:hypothetical protein
MPQDRARQTGPTTFDVGLYAAGLREARDVVRRATPEQLAALTDDERALLIEQGAMLPSRTVNGSLLSMLAQAPMRPMPSPGPTPAPEADWARAAISMGLRTAPAILGGAVGALGGPVGMAAGGAFGSSLGELLGQRYDRPDAPVNPWSVGVAGALGAVPGLGAGRAVTRLGLNAAEAALPTVTSALADNAVRRTLQAAGTGLLMAPPSTVATNWAEGRPLTQNMALNTALGGAFGAGTGAAVEAARAAAPSAARGAQVARDTLGDLMAQHPELAARLADETGAVGDVAGARAARQAVADAQAAALDAAGDTAIVDDLADDLADDVSEEAVKGSAGWFPRPLKAYLDDIAVTMREQQRANWIAAGKDPKKFGPQVAEIQTAIKDIIRNDISKGDAREAQRLIDGYFTTALPTNYRGVNFDVRRPVHQLFRTGTSAGAATFDDVSRQRLALAYEQGVKRAAREQWGDSRWLYHLSNGDPTTAVQLTRMLGAFSPGQKTDANTLNAIEAFLRSMAGESADSILGRKVPDPARPGKMMRVGASLSTGHPRPSTVEDNLRRAMKLGRIFAEKVEALAGAELGLHDDIPIDLWLMRAIGASSDTTPQGAAYRLISEAMAKEAEAQGENPFMYMAKVWMGMQDIVGTPSPSFAESAARLRLSGHLQTPGIVEGTLGNIAYHAAGVKDPSVGGAYSIVATNPRLSFADWEREAQALFRQGKERDVLGKQAIPKESDPVAIDAYIDEMLNAERLDNMMRGAKREQSVIGNLVIEAAPGSKSGVATGHKALSLEEKQARDRLALKALVNRATRKVGVAEALFPGRTARPIPGEGYWPTSQGVERNLLSVIPIELPTAPSGRRLPADVTRKAMTLGHLLGLGLGQNAVPLTAVQFADVGLPKNTVRVWGSAGEKVPRRVQDISAQLPAGEDYVVQHRDTGVDVFPPSGRTLSIDERKALPAAVKGVMTDKGLRGAGARLGSILPGDHNYMTPTWGERGSQKATRTLLQWWGGLSGADKRALDPEVQDTFGRLYRQQKKDPTNPQDYMTVLKLLADGGVSGLARALKQNPSLQVPAVLLPALGLGTLYTPRQSESADEP